MYVQWVGVQSFIGMLPTPPTGLNTVQSPFRETLPINGDTQSLLHNKILIFVGDDSIECHSINITLIIKIILAGRALILLARSAPA
jgi:hypothetical protein